MEIPKIKISNKLVKCIFIGSTGLFAGLGTTLSLAGVPALLASADPLPTWRVIYRRGKNIAITCILISAGTALHLLYKKGDLRYLLSAGLNVAVIPFTIKFMKPTNDALFALKGSNPQETSSSAKKLILTWDGLQWVRTTLGISAFVIALSAVFYK